MIGLTATVSLDNTEPKNTNRAEPIEIALMVDPIKGWLNQSVRSLPLAHSPMHSSLSNVTD